MLRSRLAMRFILSSFCLLVFVSCSSEPTSDGKAVGTWIDLLRHDDWSVQEEAQNNLTRMGKSAVPYLERGLRTRDPTLRRGLVTTLGKIGPDAKSSVPQLLSTISREKAAIIRTSIIQALATINPKDKKVIEEFNRRLKDVDPDVRKAAKLALRPPVVKPKALVINGLQKKAISPVKVEFVLRQAVHQEIEKKLPGVSFGFIAEISRKDRRGAIVWPGIRQGKILDDDIVAFVFEKSNKKDWTFIEQVGPLQGPDASAKLSKALGGPDLQKVIRPCGIAREEMQSFINEHINAFSKALQSGKDEKAMGEFEQLTRVFSFSMLAFDDFLPKILSGKLDSWKWALDTSVEGDELVLHASMDGKDLIGTVDLRPCADGLVIGKVDIQQ